MSSIITVHIYLHSTLVKYSPDGKSRKLSVDLPENSILDDLLRKLGINQTEQLLLLAVNGKVADIDHDLEDQDSVHLMMPISGG